MATEIINYSDTIIRVLNGNVDTPFSVDILKGSYTTREIDEDNLEVIFYDYTKNNFRNRVVINYADVTTRTLTSNTQLISYLNEINAELFPRMYYPSFLFL